MKVKISAAHFMAEAGLAEAIQALKSAKTLQKPPPAHHNAPLNLGKIVF